MGKIHFRDYYTSENIFLEKNPNTIFPGIIIKKKLDLEGSLCSYVDFVLWFYFYSNVSYSGKILG